MPEEIKSILIHTTEEKHQQLRVIKSILNMTWEQLLVDYYLELTQRAIEKNREEMLEKYYEDLKIRQSST